MAKGKKKNSVKKTMTPRIANRRAFRDYDVEEKLETGIELLGSEVKSIRNGQASLAEGFAKIETDPLELYLYNVEIAHYRQAGINQHEPKRPRKLLAHKRQIRELQGKTSSKGVTLIPLAMYFKRGMVKVEVGVARGKREHDKREDIKKRDADRAMRRAMTRAKI
ncbi:MAG: SsrA-binding protein SmpB [Phycisphaeraceae bacterium]